MRGAKINLKIKLPLCFLLICIIFSSCSNINDEKAELIQSLSSVTSAEYTAHITASFPDKEAEFTVLYTHSPENDRASIIAPSEVTGVSYTISGDTGFIEFDGAILEIGRLDETGVSPFSAIYSLLSTWKRGAFSEVTRTVMHGDAAYLVISHDKKDASELEYRTWFSKDNILPLYAEIFSDGERIITCEFERAEHNTK